MQRNENDALQPAGQHRSAGQRRFYALEVVAAAVLIVNLLAVGWIVIVSYRPNWLRMASLEREVVIVTALLVAALLLVSVIALVHTRKER